MSRERADRVALAERVGEALGKLLTGARALVRAEKREADGETFHGAADAVTELGKRALAYSRSIERVRAGAKA